MSSKKIATSTAATPATYAVPNSGGSYTRNPDGSLTQNELPTEPAVAGEPVAEAAADQPEQE